MPKKLYQKEINEKRYQKYKEIEASLGNLSNQVTRRYKFERAAEEMDCSWVTIRQVVQEREKMERWNK